MDKPNTIKKVDNDEFKIFSTAPSKKWPRVIGFGLLGLGAVLLVAYCTFEIGSIAMTFISDQTPWPVALLVVVVAAIVGLHFLP